VSVTEVGEGLTEGMVEFGETDPELQAVKVTNRMKMEENKPLI
jgi:hypothetical protein